MNLSTDQVKSLVKLVDDEIERNNQDGDDAYNTYWENIKAVLNDKA